MHLKRSLPLCITTHMTHNVSPHCTPCPYNPLVVYLYPQRARNPQVKEVPFSPTNPPMWPICIGKVKSLHKKGGVFMINHIISSTQYEMYE